MRIDVCRVFFFWPREKSGKPQIIFEFLTLVIRHRFFRPRNPKSYFLGKYKKTRAENDRDPSFQKLIWSHMMPFGVKSDPSFWAQKQRIRVRVSSFRTAETVFCLQFACVPFPHPRCHIPWESPWDAPTCDAPCDVPAAPTRFSSPFYIFARGLPALNRKTHILFATRWPTV